MAQSSLPFCIFFALLCAVFADESSETTSAIAEAREEEEWGHTYYLTLRGELLTIAGHGQQMSANVVKSRQFAAKGRRLSSESAAKPGGVLVQRIWVEQDLIEN